MNAVAIHRRESLQPQTFEQMMKFAVLIAEQPDASKQAAEAA